MQTLATKALPHHIPNNISEPFAQNLDMQRLGTRCWKTLVEKGVPSQDARELAIAVSHFIYLNTLPSEYQKSLIEQYYQQLRAADILSLQFN
ncbi:MAG: hypothetical protein AAF572_18860 [Cyanobacteria bacterium P01_B01_bin.77]